jgi:dienelactone hydrolase
MHRSPPRPARRRLLLQATAAFLVAPGLVRAQGLSARADETAGAGVHALEWTDTARQRLLPLRLRLPPGDAAVPLVLFSHGLGGDLDAGTWWAEAWARAGIATLHLQHPGSDAVVARQGLRALVAAADGTQLRARAADVAFVLDELARRRARGDELLRRLQPEAVGLAGHSFGAHTTLAVAGQRLAGRAQLADARVRAFAAFSPSPGQRNDPGDAFAAVTRPVLCLSGTRDTDPLGLSAFNAGEDRSADGRWRRAVYDALPAGDKAELWLDGADHASFAGTEPGGGRWRARRRDAAAREQAPRHRALIEDTSTRWWRAQLLGDGQARASLAHPPPGLGPADEWRRG